MNTKPGFVAAWFGATILSLFFAVGFLTYLSSEKVVILSHNSNLKLYSSLPNSVMETADAVVGRDGRAKSIEEFFKAYKAPLAEQADLFVEVADKYSLDWRLLPAISMQESNGGKRIIPSSKNPFGYGIYADKVLKFDSFEAAIERVGRGLKEDYIEKGLKNPNQIMTKYTPPSLEKGGAWAKGVVAFMEELR